MVSNVVCQAIDVGLKIATGNSITKATGWTIEGSDFVALV